MKTTLPSGSLPRAFHARAFTLPEVALSVGIATICLLTLLGMVPFGLDTIRESANRQAEARMVQSITTFFQTTPWVTQDKGSGTTTIELKDKLFFFDQTGAEVANAADIDRMYVVEAKVDVMPPTLQGDNWANPYLRKLRLRFTDRTNYAEALKDDSKHFTQRTVWVANLEQTGPVTKL
jgi:uncharacterized protein (TIGR02598 family)